MPLIDAATSENSASPAVDAQRWPFDLTANVVLWCFGGKLFFLG